MKIEEISKCLKMLAMIMASRDLLPKKAFVYLTSESTYQELLKASEMKKYEDLVIRNGRNQTFINMPLYERLQIEKHHLRNRKSTKELKETQKLMKEQGILRKDII